MRDVAGRDMGMSVEGWVDDRMKSELLHVFGFGDVFSSGDELI